MDTSVISMRLPTSLVAALDRRADSEQRSRANMTAVLIKSALDETGTTVPKTEDKENTE